MAAKTWIPARNKGQGKKRQTRKSTKGEKGPKQRHIAILHAPQAASFSNLFPIL